MTTSQNESMSYIDKLVKTVPLKRDPEKCPVSKADRIRWGLIIGGVIGILGGAIYNSIDFIFLPGIPMALPPFGWLSNVFTFTLLGAISGIFVALPKQFVGGIFLGALAIFLCSRIWIFMIEYIPSVGAINLIIYMLRDSIHLYFYYCWIMLLSIPIRWIIDWINGMKEPLFEKTDRVRFAVYVMLLSVIIGMFGLTPRHEREYVQFVYDTVMVANSAAKIEDYPVILGKENVSAAFGKYSTDRFHIRVERRFFWGANVLNIQQPVMEEIVVKYDNDWQLACGVGREYIFYCVGSDLFFKYQSGGA